jgi:hypothetical protein
MLINAAHDLKGQYSPTEAGKIPNNGEGFGRVNMVETVRSNDNLGWVQYWDENSALDTGEEQSFEVNLDKLAKTVKVTLVWTDPPGETLQNDLDLIVKNSKGTVKHGNMGGSSKKFDRNNNVEQVVFTTVAPGKLTVTVRAFRAAIQPQSFALAVRATF